MHSVRDEKVSVRSDAGRTGYALFARLVEVRVEKRNIVRADESDDTGVGFGKFERLFRN